MGDKISNMNKNNPALNDLTRFHGFYDNVYRDPFINGNAFIFVTKPLLFIDPYMPNDRRSAGMMAYANMTKDPYFSQFIASESMNQMDLEIVKSLSYKTDYSESSFLPVFTNECRSFDVNDINMEANDDFATKQGYRESLPTYKTASESAGQLSMTMTDDSNLDITKMMSIWVNYISGITDGTFDANPDMIASGTLDYTCSIYYMVLAEDGRTLKYWSRYTGCWPTTIPYSALRYAKGSQEPIDVNLTFQYSVKEDMSPKILEEFNMLALRLAGSRAVSAASIRNEIDGMYSSISQSPWLNKDVMSSTIPAAREILSSDHRDPLVLYRPESAKGVNPDALPAHFELIFDDYGYTASHLDGIMDGNGYINDAATNFAKSDDAQKEWDMSGFWDEPSI